MIELVITSPPVNVVENMLSETSQDLSLSRSNRPEMTEVQCERRSFVH